MFRIGHLGDFNDLMLMGTLSGVEMALGLAKVPHKPAGVQAALTYLRDTAPGARHWPAVNRGGDSCSATTEAASVLSTAVSKVAPGETKPPDTSPSRSRS